MEKVKASDVVRQLEQSVEKIKQIIEKAKKTGEEIQKGKIIPPKQ